MKIRKTVIITIVFVLTSSISVISYLILSDRNETFKVLQNETEEQEMLELTKSESIEEKINNIDRDSYTEYLDEQIPLRFNYPANWNLYPKNIIAFNGLKQKDIILRSDKNIINVLVRESGGKESIGVQSDNVYGYDFYEIEYDRGKLLFPLVDENSPKANNAFQVFFLPDGNEEVENYFSVGGWDYSIVVDLNDYSTEELARLIDFLSNIQYE